MDFAYPVGMSTFVLCFILLALPFSFSIEPANERVLVVAQSASLQLSLGLPVKNSPGSKPGTSMVCERVHIHGLSRLKNLKKIAHSVKVKLSGTNTSVFLPNAEVCFHRNLSLGIGMCPQGQWEKVKGSWVKSMSPFDHKVLDIRTASSSLERFEVSIEEEFFLYRVIFFIVGIVMMSLASSLSKSLVFYYSSAMAIGVILVILMVLFQGMKLLPTGRKGSLAIFIYSSIVGLGSFLLRYIPGLLRSVLTEIGINEDMYNPLAIFLLAFVILGGAWLGFWVVRKLVLTEDGSIDLSTSMFVAWSIRILAAVMILQSSADPLLAMEALAFGIMVSSILRRVLKLRVLRHMYKALMKSPKKNRRRSYIPNSSPFEDSLEEYMYKIKGNEDYKFVRPRSKAFNLSPCSSSDKDLSQRLRSEQLGKELYLSSFHSTPERRRFTKNEWEEFTRGSTEKALEELVSSPDFGKWLVKNNDRITITPNTSRAERQRRKWFLWF
ncbi:hypothetical protein FEM48_Zijuj08G0130600 [Ziziphus jujuba var. spinosa]|uniref:Nuclear envelope integral membrane protein 1 n=1 Tax=Ziziphus jujuba var. spinosa TaxID=714518 RepID=A0A978UZ95_ZIZJJ|nr:hypothetical protein FEM48_Zijuj08G0130600 [Ziziphus jujuba var. spinosa]